MKHKNDKATLSLSLAALGVVFGDIGTSPLYTIRECFLGHHSLELSEQNILGVLSTLVWSLIMIISLKYVAIVMQAHNKGEGGILALTALLSRKLNKQNASKSRFKKIFLFIGIFGTALLYADGMITPAISVLSALEGLVEVTPKFRPFITIIAIIVMLALFGLQQRGTAVIGKLFGPFVLTWFVVLGILGSISIYQTPIVLWALNPIYLFKFFYNAPHEAFLSLGSLFLVVTGAEALYADMGHFGAKPIKKAWNFVVLPALMLNYLGQGALLTRIGHQVQNPFYELAPQWGVFPLVIFATLISAIASQAIISGAYSMTRQAIQLGLLPRMQIDFTSESHEGQIYIPAVNNFLAIGTILLVIIFKTSSNLAAAYGIGVSLIMLLTTTLIFLMAKKVWRWNVFILYSVFLVFLIVDLGFVSANSLKIVDGGWFTIVVSMAIFSVMTTWARGRELLGARLQEKGISWEKFQSKVRSMNVARVPGTAIFMTKSGNVTPTPLIHNVTHNKIIHEMVLLLTIEVERVPYVDLAERLMVEKIGEGIFRVTSHYGFKDEPDVNKILQICKQKDLPISDDVTFFLGREILIPTDNPGMAIWREKLFSYMSRNAQRATTFYKVPSDQVFEVGIQVEI